MDLKEGLSIDTWAKYSPPVNELPQKISSENPFFTSFGSCQHQQKLESTSMLDYDMGTGPTFQEFDTFSKLQPILPSNPGNEVRISGQVEERMNAALQPNKTQDWDPKATLNNLSFLEEKIHQLQDLVNLIVGRRGQLLGRPDKLVIQQQQLITADLTSIIVQLISTAGSLLPSVKHTLSTETPIEQPGGILFPSVAAANGSGSKVSDQSKPMDVSNNCGMEHNYSVEEHESKDEEDAEEGENLQPGSYEILQLEKEEILAPHTHFCTICGKGFKRDANLRMHMRGHGDEYKTPAALAKPHKESNSEPVLIKRYSCPFAGCKRNKDHKKFQPLKTILCVKNHYKRTHCDKSYICSRCNAKKFSVIADLKTHEKHCGKDKWLCSCGTTFSRKDKLFGHITLFQGHTPAIPPDETKGSVGPSDKVDENEAANKLGTTNFSFCANASNALEAQSTTDAKGVDDLISCYSPFNFDTCNFGGFHEFPRSIFNDSETSLSFLVSGSCNYSQKTVGESSSSDI